MTRARQKRRRTKRGLIAQRCKAQHKTTGASEKTKSRKAEHSSTRCPWRGRTKSRHDENDNVFNANGKARSAQRETARGLSSRQRTSVVEQVLAASHGALHERFVLKCQASDSRPGTLQGLCEGKHLSLITTMVNVQPQPPGWKKRMGCACHCQTTNKGKRAPNAPQPLNNATLQHQHIATLNVKSWTNRSSCTQMHFGG